MLTIHFTFLQGLYCIWDVTSPSSPIRILTAPGVPTALGFSAGQTFLVLAGTVEGSLHLWDLRESNALHVDRSERIPANILCSIHITAHYFFIMLIFINNRDATDLKVYTGVRKACFTAFDHYEEISRAGTAANRGDFSETGQHSAAIVQVRFYIDVLFIATNVFSLINIGFQHFRLSRLTPAVDII